MFWFYVFEISVTEISASVPVQCRWMRCYLRCSQHWKVTWIKQQQKLLCPGSMPVIVIIHRTLIRTTSVTESRSSKNLRDRRNIKKKPYSICMAGNHKNTWENIYFWELEAVLVTEMDSDTTCFLTTRGSLPLTADTGTFPLCYSAEVLRY